jgi:hypothetical protein
MHAIVSEEERNACPKRRSNIARGMFAIARTFRTTKAAAHGWRSKFSTAPGTFTSVTIVVRT